MDESTNPYAVGAAVVEDVGPERRLNPWLSIWTKPRRTMRQILDDDPERLVLVLAALGGISQALDNASTRSAADHLSLLAVLAGAVALGAVGGIVGLYVSAVVLRVTGSWLGGTASSRELRAALAWPNVLTAWALLLWIPELLLFGRELFTTEMPRTDASLPLTVTFFCFAFVEIVIAIWSVVVVVKCVAEAQRFSAWRALGSICVAIAFVLGVLLAILVPFLLLAR